MKRLKKILALALALGLAFSVVACSNESASDATELEKSNEEIKVNPDENVFSADLDDYAGEGNTLIYHALGGGTPEDWDIVGAEINSYLDEHMNTQLEVIFHSWGDFESNLNTIINGGEYYDIAFGSSISGVNRFAQNGVFADIKKLLPAAPNLEALIPESVWTGMTLPNGEIFGVPAYKDSAATQYFLFDKELMDKNNIDYTKINNFETLEPALEKLKQSDPSFYPLTFNQAGFFNLNWDYELLGGGAAVKFGDTKVVNLYEQEEVQERFRKLSEWNEKGYINPDAYITTSVDTQYIHARAGYPGAETVWSNDFDKPMVITPRSFPYYTTASIQGSFVVISDASKYKEDAIKVIERINIDKYLRNLCTYGIEGIHYNFVEGKQNTIQRTERAIKSYNPANYTIGQFMNLYVEDPNPENQWLIVHEQNKEARTSPLLGFIFDTSEVEGTVSALENIITKFGPALRTGALDTDEILTQMLDEMKQAGIDEVITEAQNQIDTFIENRKKS